MTMLMIIWSKLYAKWKKFLLLYKRTYKCPPIVQRENVLETLRSDSEKGDPHHKIGQFHNCPILLFMVSMSCLCFSIDFSEVDVLI